MSGPNINSLKRVFEKFKNEIIQEIPNELSECEICRKTECSEDKFISCKNRIVHMNCLEEMKKKE